jgi:hypothetical protein
MHEAGGNPAPKHHRIEQNAPFPVLLLPNRRPQVIRGTAFGIVLWLVSDRILIPLFKLGRPWSRYSISVRSNALASHLAYALIVEFACRTRESE